MVAVSFLLVALNFGIGLGYQAKAETFSEVLKKRQQDEAGKAAASESAKAEPAASKADSKTETKAETKAVEAESTPAATESSAPKKKHKREQRREVAAAESSPSVNSLNTGDRAQLVLTLGDTCFKVEFAARAGEILSCKEPLPIQYNKGTCGGIEALETGKVDAIVSCLDSYRFGLKFRTSDKLVSSELEVRRETVGRDGVGTRYVVRSANFEDSPLANMLPAPTLIELNKEKQEEAPIAVKISGYAWVETERTDGFGYDSAGSDMANFGDRSPSQNVQSFVGQLSAEVSRGRVDGGFCFGRRRDFLWRCHHGWRAGAGNTTWYFD